MNIGGLATSAANYSGLSDAYAFLRRRVTESQVAILMYHRVCPRKDEWSPKSSEVDPGNFEQQMLYLSRKCRTLSLHEAVEYIQRGRVFPQKAVVVTFDDGYKDNYIYAYPILKKYHMPAIVFLATGHINTGELFWWQKVAYAIYYTSITELNFELGRFSLQSELEKSYASSVIIERLKKMSWKKMNLIIQRLVDICRVKISNDFSRNLLLSWEDVREMNDEGISFGAHSVNHPILTNMPIEEAEFEITQSKKDLEDKLGKEVTAFSYPNGNFNSEIVELLSRNGFACAVSILEKLTGRKDNVYELSRMGVSGDFGKFKGKICGLWNDLPARLRSAVYPSLEGVY